MTCPRCAQEPCATLADSPVPGVWTVWLCPRCHYSWRSTEPPANSDRAHYPAEFRLTPDDIANAPEVPPKPARG